MAQAHEQARTEYGERVALILEEEGLRSEQGFQVARLKALVLRRTGQALAERHLKAVLYQGVEPSVALVEQLARGLRADARRFFVHQSARPTTQKRTPRDAPSALEQLNEELRVESSRRRHARKKRRSRP
jgi:hypothetical protein